MYVQQYSQYRLHLFILKACLASVLNNCTHHSALRVSDNGISCVSTSTCCFTIFFTMATAPLLVLLTDDFFVKEAGINSKLAECKTCDNLNPQLHKNRSCAKM